MGSRRLEEARQVLASPSFGVAAQMEMLLSARPYANLSDEAKELFRNALLFTDPPLHTRLRSVINRAFTPRQMARLEPRIQTLSDRLLARIGDDPAPELVASFSEQLPIQVIGELIGLPEEQWPWLTKTSTTLRTMLDALTVIDPTVVDATAREITATFADLIERRRVDPQDDLISSPAASAADGQLNRSELAALVTILLIAGHETATGAIGNAIVALGRHPDQRAWIRANPHAWPNAIEELLRFDSPVHTDPRAAFEDVVIGGRTIKKGQNLTVMLGAVNRDPARFDHPDQLRLDRPDPSPLSFGHGAHHCIGAALVRAELRVALPALLDTLGDYDILEADLRWKPSIAFRGPSRLHVRPHKPVPTAT